MKPKTKKILKGVGAGLLALGAVGTLASVRGTETRHQNRKNKIAEREASDGYNRVMGEQLKNLYKKAYVESRGGDTPYQKTSTPKYNFAPPRPRPSNLNWHEPPEDLDVWYDAIEG